MSTTKFTNCERVKSWEERRWEKKIKEKTWQKGNYELGSTTRKQENTSVRTEKNLFEGDKDGGWK